jgi:hypothetical protein
MPMKGVDYDTV